MNTRKLLFLGSKDAGLEALKCLLNHLPQGCIPAIVCPDDRSDPRNAHEGFVQLAQQHNIPLHLAQTAQETSGLIERHTPDTVLVHGWYRMIPVAQFHDVDFLGFHYSPLPRYRGNAPLVWQIIQGETRLGVSFFTLTQGMDDGDLVDQSMFELAPHEDISDAIRMANQRVATMLEKFVPQWLTGHVPKRRQPEGAPSYCGLRTPDDGHIDWRADAVAVNNFIRAQARPYPGAFSRLATGQTVRFWRSETEHRQFHGTPGAVVEVGTNAIVIACGNGAIKVTQAELEGDESAIEMQPSLRSLKVRFK